jgi:tetratricopeptide (TPR) repeat protein
MRFKGFFFALLIVVSIIALFFLSNSSSASKTALFPPDILFEENEEAYRANNIGVALLEQYKHKEGADEFRRALKINPELVMARINLCIALFYSQDLRPAQEAAKAALEIAPDAPQPHYILGLMARSENRLDDALASFQKVLKVDPKDVGANVNVGQIHSLRRQYDEAVKAFRVAMEAEPYNTSAVYNLATTLSRMGQREEAQELLQKFQVLRQSGAGTSIGTNYLEQGRYAEAIASTGMEKELVDKDAPNVTFKDATKEVLPLSKTTTKTSVPALDQTIKPSTWSEATKRKLVQPFAGGATLFDFDADGYPDLLQLTQTGQKLLRNNKGKFVDVTALSGDLNKLTTGIGVGAVAGDYNNDTKPDIFILRYGTSSLYRNEGNGKFTDVTKEAEIPTYTYLSISVAMLDADHDGDLDIFIAGFADIAKNPFKDSKNNVAYFPTSFALAPNMLLRNNGDGKFTDISTASKVAGPTGRAVSIVPTDYDNRRDVDLMIANYGDTPTLFRNLRDSTFRNVAPEVLHVQKRTYAALAVCDYNKDSFPDFFFGDRFGSGIFATSDGRGGFVLATPPPELSSVRAAQFVDYDNDGLVDLIAVTDKGLRAARNVGIRGGGSNDLVRGANWQVVPIQADNLSNVSSSRFIVSGDVDADGDVDLFARANDGSLKFIRNDGGNRNHSAHIRLEGKVSNRSGFGSKIDMRAGSLTQKLETYSSTPAPAPSEIIFGLGQREKPDAIRVIWPAGITQAETEILPSPQASRATTITELDRKPSSCPFLYTWNGERFVFLTDFMGGGEMAYWEGYGSYNHPDPDEYVRIAGDDLKPKDGRYELRVTNELEEVLYVDHLQLIAVDHPKGTEVYPNEGLANPTSSKFILYRTRAAKPPLSAIDDDGNDVLSRLVHVDRKYVDSFKLHSTRGYADEHSLILKLDDKKDFKGRALLLMNGWTDYAFSSDNVAASQMNKSLVFPSLQVKDKQGEWKTVIENIGIPVGRPQTMTVDLTGTFLSDSREVRIVTNMRVYWDQILVDTSNDESEVRMTQLEPIKADLRLRGFSLETSPDDKEPYGYDYDKVSFTSPWKNFAGTFTREGDVRKLLTEIDDIYVISRTGDEISLSFDANALPALSDGWSRTFLLYSFGYSKEMDINSGSPDVVMPLPFRGMTKYPYTAPESYPLTPERQSYLEQYNTRRVAFTIPRIESVLIAR